MKAFILSKPGRLEQVDLPIPQPGPYEIRIKVACVGICGSDVEVFKGNRSPEFLTNPIRLGHEPSGIIDAVGTHITHLQIGDRVTCVGTWGAFSDYIVVPAERCLKLLPEISLQDGSLIEVLPGVIYAASRVGIGPAHDVLIVGQGLSGLLITRMVYLNGCKKLIVADLFDEKLKIAREFGATHTINALQENLGERLREIAPAGADFTIMATLDGNDVASALDWTAVQGKVVLYGSISHCSHIDFFKQHSKAISIVKESQGTHGWLERRRV